MRKSGRSSWKRSFNAWERFRRTPGAIVSATLSKIGPTAQSVKRPVPRKPTPVPLPQAPTPASWTDVDADSLETPPDPVETNADLVLDEDEDGNGFDEDEDTQQVEAAADVSVEVVAEPDQSAEAVAEPDQPAEATDGTVTAESFQQEDSAPESTDSDHDPGVQVLEVPDTSSENVQTEAVEDSADDTQPETPEDDTQPETPEGIAGQGTEAAAPVQPDGETLELAETDQPVAGEPDERADALPDNDDDIQGQVAPADDVEPEAHGPGIEADEDQPEAIVAADEDQPEAIVAADEDQPEEIVAADEATDTVAATEVDLAEESDIDAIIPVGDDSATEVADDPSEEEPEALEETSEVTTEPEPSRRPGRLSIKEPLAWLLVDVASLIGAIYMLGNTFLIWFTLGVDFELKNNRAKMLRHDIAQIAMFVSLGFMIWCFVLLILLASQLSQWRHGVPSLKRLVASTVFTVIAIGIGWFAWIQMVLIDSPRNAAFGIVCGLLHALVWAAAAIFTWLAYRKFTAGDATAAATEPAEYTDETSDEAPTGDIGSTQDDEPDSGDEVDESAGAHLAPIATTRRDRRSRPLRQRRPPTRGQAARRDRRGRPIRRPGTDHGFRPAEADPLKAATKYRRNRPLRRTRPKVKRGRRDLDPRRRSARLNRAAVRKRRTSSEPVAG